MDESPKQLIEEGRPSQGMKPAMKRGWIMNMYGTGSSIYLWLMNR
jgi:hypothetical protein